MFHSSKLFCLPGFQGDYKMSEGAKSGPPQKIAPIEALALSLVELKEATDNFGAKALIGEGSYGRVYYAMLSDGQPAAIKKLDVNSQPEANSEFLAQVLYIFKNGPQMARQF